MKARKQQKTETYQDILKRTPGSARIKIIDACFGPRFLGGADFCVFRSESEARAEIDILRNNGNALVIDEWEIHIFRGDAWVLKAAGYFDDSNAPGRKDTAQ